MVRLWPTRPSTGVEVPPFDERGSVIDLTRNLGEVEVQTGESLCLELVVGNWTAENANPEAIRFKDTLHGDASSWQGRRIPARLQAWRLWYRIEEAGVPSY
jgi:hypothetical protein